MTTDNEARARNMQYFMELLDHLDMRDAEAVEEFAGSIVDALAEARRDERERIARLIEFQAKGTETTARDGAGGPAMSKGDDMVHDYLRDVADWIPAEAVPEYWKHALKLASRIDAALDEAERRGRETALEEAANCIAMLCDMFDGEQDIESWIEEVEVNDRELASSIRALKTTTGDSK